MLILTRNSSNIKIKEDKFKMSANCDENQNTRKCICNYPYNHCSSCRFSFSWNDSNLFFTFLKRFIIISYYRKKRKRRDMYCKKKLSDFCVLILKTFIKIFCMSSCQKMKAAPSIQSTGHKTKNKQSSSNLAYILFLALLFLHQIT